MTSLEYEDFFLIFGGPDEKRMKLGLPSLGGRRCFL
jgi:hypothetical protein